MARGRRGVTLAGPPVHDRRAKELTHQDVAAEEVDDPFEEGATILVLRNLRDDPIAAMRQAGQVDECQYMAGRHWQKAYELAEIGGAKAIDYGKEKVDGGQIAQATLSDQQARAFADLSKAQAALGDYGSSVVHDILAQHMTLQQCCDRRMMVRDVEVRFLGRRFRECLDTLAKIFGYTT
jgi:hypothetical protein